ncbi:MAG: flagellar basal-body rod protein FlgG [Rhodospirillaceae bacterium]|nr:flagellar basal-body rod protein FlgG [Rhodospirillaceae bacterium]
MQSLNISATGMLAQEMNVQVLANNIANVNTTGFKRQRAEFQDLLYQTLERVAPVSSDPGVSVPAGVQLGTGVELSSTYRVHEQGGMQMTDNPMDLALDGRGFFQIELPNGDTAYTRAGEFQLNAQGEIVTPEGFRLIGPGPVPVDATDVGINAEGRIFVTLAGQEEPSDAGQIELAAFANEGGLEALGDNLFVQTVASGQPTTGAPGTEGLGTIKQGMLEASNVDIIGEITQLIAAQRAYEMNAKVVKISDDMMQSTNNLR